MAGWGAWKLGLLCSLSGCAGVVDPPHLQTLAVSAATASGTPVAGLACLLRNDQGEWHAVTPGRVTVRRSTQPLAVRCDDAQWQTVPGSSDAIAAGKVGVGAVAVGGGLGGVAAAASIGVAGGTAVAAAAAAPLFLIGAMLGSGLAYLGGKTKAGHHYPNSVVVVVEPRPAAPR